MFVDVKTENKIKLLAAPDKDCVVVEIIVITKLNQAPTQASATYRPPAGPSVKVVKKLEIILTTLIISAHADGVLVPGSVHARPSARPPSTWHCSG